MSNHKLYQHPPIESKWHRESSDSPSCRKARMRTGIVTHWFNEDDLKGLGFIRLPYRHTSLCLQSVLEPYC